MKKAILLTLTVMLITPGIIAQETHTVGIEGFAYVPAELTVNVGDTVIFVGTSFHPLTEVSEATWTNNGATHLEGGFDFPGGNGTVIMTEAGVRYYVCTAHVASNQMKGIITVVTATGIPNLQENGTVSVYPVPLTGSTLFVTFRDPAQKNLSVTVYDLAGNLRISSAGLTENGKFSIDCTYLPSGMYMMKLSSEEGESYTKFIRQ